MKKLCVFLVIIFCLLPAGLGESAPAGGVASADGRVLELISRSAILMDAYTGEVLYENTRTTAATPQAPPRS